jgi:hypothetical protein
MRILILLMVCWPILAQAQYGIRGSFLTYDRLSKGAHTYGSVGVDLDVSDRTSIGADFLFRLNLFGETELSDYVQYAGYSVDYILTPRSTQFLLRSSYFFSDDRGFYVSSSFGVRKVSAEVIPSTYDPTGFNQLPAWVVRETAETTLFPIGLRFGVRGELDGWYGDLFVGVGYMLGERNLFKAPYLEAKDREIAGLSIQAGYALGIGW